MDPIPGAGRSEVNGAGGMALSEHERKILDEIERQFKKEGPEITDEISDYAAFSHRWIRFSVLGTVVGAALLCTFFFSEMLALVGFGLTVVSVSALVTIIRRERRRAAGRDGLKFDPRFIRRFFHS